MNGAAAHPGGPVRVLLVHGELDLGTADSLCARGRQVIGGDARVLLLDLAGLSFCDARGLSAFVRIANAADAVGCRYALVAPQPQVARIIGITGLDQRLPVYASTADALARLAMEETGPEAGPPPAAGAATRPAA